MAITTSGKDKVQKYMRAYIAGYDISGDTRAFNELSNTLEDIDVTGWANALEQHAAGRRSSGIRGFEAIANQTAGQSLTVLQTPNVDKIAVIAFGGGGEPAIGDPTFHSIGRLVSSSVALNAGRALISGDIIARPGVAGWTNPLGVLVQPVSDSIDATLTASSSTSIDLGTIIPRTNGASATLQILSSASGDFVFKIKDSTDDSAFNDLVTFVIDGSAVATEHQIVLPATTIDRYIAFDAVRTAGTVTVVCTFALNNVFQIV